MNLSIALFIIGILGFVLNRKNIILMLISIEVMLLSVTLLILVSSYAFDDIVGQTYSIYIIAIAGAESAIGLGILVAYYRLRGTIALNLYLTLLLLPLFGSVIGGLMGRKIGTSGVQLVTTLLVGVSATLTCVAFYEVAIKGHTVTISLGNWMDSEIMDIAWAFSFDSLTVSMLLPVLVVSTFVHVFSIDYMAGDPHAQRFFAYLSMFTFCMLVLVTGDNYLIMFLGWEGIGISSYLLINFWFTRIQANKSAIKALVVNRVGDMFLSVGFFALLFMIGNVDYSTAFTLAPFLNEDAVTIVGLLFLLAAMGKSAQLGLHQWLPDAMEGPTPVSALIHAATLVTAGVYLLMRSSPILEHSSTALVAVTWVGAVTAFFAASTGLMQNDLKRVIAYSTCSQMGYLFMACGLSQYNVALFHLVNHAFFKALLFLAAGAVLHATNDQQDQRRLGGLIAFLPFTYVAILIGSLSLMAVPWMTGFYSKDLILEVAYGQYSFSSHIAYWMGTLSACLTAFYSMRLISLTFMSYPNASKKIYAGVHDAPTIVVVPLTLLALLAIFFGFVARDLFVGLGSDFAAGTLFIAPNHIALVEAEFGISQLAKLLPAIGTFASAILAMYVYQFSTVELSRSQWYRTLYNFFNGKYFIDVLYNRYVLYPGLRLGYAISKALDRGLIEQVGPTGLSSSLSSASTSLARLDTGNLTDYALYMGIGMVSITSLIIAAPSLSDSVSLLTLSLAFAVLCCTASRAASSTE